MQANRSRIAMGKADWEANRNQAAKPVGRQAFTTFLIPNAFGMAQHINASEKE